MTGRSTPRLVVLLLAALLVLAFAAVSVVTLAEEGITPGSLLLVVPSLGVVLVVGVGIGGALGRGSNRGR